MDLACQLLRDPALTRCSDSLTTTQPRAGSRITVTVGSGSTVRPTLGVPPKPSGMEAAALANALSYERRACAEPAAALDEIATALNLPTTADTTEIVTAVHRARAEALELAEERDKCRRRADYEHLSRAELTTALDEIATALGLSVMTVTADLVLAAQASASAAREWQARAEALADERRTLQLELDAARATIETLRPTNPPPQGGRGDVWASLIASLADDDPMRAACVARREVGLSRYGQPLRWADSRDASRDLVEELLDAAAYAWRLGDADLAWQLLAAASEWAGVVPAWKWWPGAQTRDVPTTADEWRDLAARGDR